MFECTAYTSRSCVAYCALLEPVLVGCEAFGVEELHPEMAAV